MTIIDAIVIQLALSHDKVQMAGIVRFRSYAFAMLTATLVMITGVIQVGFVVNSAGEYAVSLGSHGDRTPVHLRDAAISVYGRSACQLGEQ